MIENLRSRSRARLDGRKPPPIGDGSIVVPCVDGAGVAAIEVEFFLPAELDPTAPFLFLVHGRERDADRYRDAWIPFARSQRRIVLAPRFSAEGFPGSAAFNQGNVVDRYGAPVERHRWTFSRIEELFDVLSVWFGHHVPNYDVYGHSAGAQFVHRLVLLVPDARVRMAVAANAGWYTVPDLGARYPYGLGGTHTGAESLRKAFRKKLVVVLGAEDTDEQDPTLRRLPPEHAQGSNRLERGIHFFDRSASVAGKLGGLAWQLVQIPGVDHDHVAMIPSVAALLEAGSSASAGPRPEADARAGTRRAHAPPWWRSLGLGFLQRS